MTSMLRILEVSWYVDALVLDLIILSDREVQMEAGSDTTASTLLSFILAMIKYPQALKKAQAEVDSVCGDSRSPTPDDINELTYLKACMNEVRKILTFGCHHSNTSIEDSKMAPCGSWRHPSYAHRRRHLRRILLT